MNENKELNITQYEKNDNILTIQRHFVGDTNINDIIKRIASEKYKKRIFPVYKNGDAIIIAI